MQNVLSVAGRMIDEKTVVLEEAVPMNNALVRVTIELPKTQPEPQPPKILQTIARIRAEQKAQGHVPRSKEEIDADIEAERNSWDD